MTLQSGPYHPIGFYHRNTTCACQIDADMDDVDIEDGEIAGEVNVLPENVVDDEVCCVMVIPSTVCDQPELSCLLALNATSDAQVLDLTQTPAQADVEPLKPRKKRKVSKVAAAAVSAVGGFFNVYGDNVSSSDGFL